MGKSIESDVYFGSSLGTISLYTTNRHFFLKEKAHSGPINCIRATDIFYEMTTLITAGEDGLVKIWTPKLE